MQQLKANPKGVFVTSYIHDMPDVLSVTDLLVARAGAMTLQELAQFELPAVLIPFAHAAGNHQLFNARERQQSGCASLLEEASLSPECLGAEIEALLFTPHRLREMRTRCRETSVAAGTETIVKTILETLGERA